jgi:anti-anti-sigma factor
MEEHLSTEERRRRLREQPVISVDRYDGAIVIRLGGEIDLYNAAVLKQALVDAAKEAPERLVLDLSEVEFIDSTALGALVEARATLVDIRSLLLAAPAHEARRALEVSGLARHLPVHDTVDAALAATL